MAHHGIHRWRGRGSDAQLQCTAHSWSWPWLRPPLRCWFFFCYSFVSSECANLLLHVKGEFMVRCAMRRRKQPTTTEQKKIVCVGWKRRPCCPTASDNETWSQSIATTTMLSYTKIKKVVYNSWHRGTYRSSRPIIASHSLSHPNQ